MKRNIFTIFIGLILFSCTESRFEEQYPDPSKTSESNVQNFFTGVLQANKDYYMPWYWRYFVVESPTMGLYTQAFGRFNGKDMYIPPSTMDDRWKQYYNMLSQYRELQRLYAVENNTNKRIFYMAATIFLYDQTQVMVDMYGAIPFTKAAYIRENLGDITASKAAYDSDKEIYTLMLDDLKSFADELNTLDIPAGFLEMFKRQDFINNGSVDLWKRHCNSLRLRLLTRMSEVPEMQNRIKTEVNTILSFPDKYPVLEKGQNILVDGKEPDLHSSKDNNIREAFETWGSSNIAPKVMIDFMNASNDPRLPVLFCKNKEGVYAGLDPQLNSTLQDSLNTAKLLSRYDSTTFSRNEKFPGVIFTGAEVSFIKAEAYARGWATGDAKKAYEQGIQQSVDLYFYLNSLGTFASNPEKPSDISIYFDAPAVAWSADRAIDLIAMQKWIHFGVIQLPHTWAEYRRLDKPVLNHYTPTGSRKTPPYRIPYPVIEQQMNTENYNKVADKDNLDTRLFWDID